MLEVWMLQGRCSELTDPDPIFFPSEFYRSKKLQATMKMCASCPVSLECSLWALGYSIESGRRMSDPIPEGIFAGLTPGERVA